MTARKLPSILLITAAAILTFAGAYLGAAFGSNWPVNRDDRTTAADTPPPTTNPPGDSIGVAACQSALEAHNSGRDVPNDPETQAMVTSALVASSNADLRHAGELWPELFELQNELLAIGDQSSPEYWDKFDQAMTLFPEFLGAIDRGCAAVGVPLPYEMTHMSLS